MLSPTDYYQQKKAGYTTDINRLKKTADRIAMLRLLLAFGAIAACIWAFQASDNMRWWVFGGLAVGFIGLVKYHNWLGELLEKLQLKVNIIDNELKALQGDNSPFAEGAAYISAAHPYSYDLDIFGKGSVYQLLCRAATLGGGKALAERLSTIALDANIIRERQAIAKELSTLPDLQQDFRVAGAVGEEGANDQQRLTDWLQGPDQFINNTVIRAISILSISLAICILGYVVFASNVNPAVGLFIVFNWIILGAYQKKIKPAITQIGDSEAFVGKLQSLQQQLAGVDFKHPWLQSVGQGAKDSLKGIKQFQGLLKLLDSRDNVLIGTTFNSLFLFDIYCLLRLESWRKKYSAALLDAIEKVMATDVYVSCSVYAFNHPSNIYPTIDEASNSIHAKDLRHPLLSPTSAVGNSMDIGNKEQFYLLTGANMTGKSTFIRTVGVTNVCCNMGLPLPADELSMPVIDLYTSMRITDSVQDDVSYFRAELNRIKAIMDKVRVADHPYMILLDEPLRGTNSTDKQQGTRSIIETLLTFHAIGIIATHDTGLGDMETNYKGKVTNYHFESKVERNGLSFDFKLKQGLSMSNNATILMKQLGIVN